MGYGAAAPNPTYDRTGVAGFGTGKARQALYDATHLDLGCALTHLFQGIADAAPPVNEWGTAITSDKHKGDTS